ncbi:hypothetical protein HYW42_04645 [Candidatus Daviesbacteria bacterium]|nr:hypothetical protein [Candidatus Daviesbacteria bacterium]
MVLGAVNSKNGVKVRLTDERWNHIITSHLEINPQGHKRILNAIGDPEVIFKGDVGELLAVCKLPRKRMWIVVAY